MQTEKIALVTGGGSGIGLAISKKLAKNNYRVIIVGRSEQSLVEACEILGNQTRYEVCDLSRLEEIPGMIRRILNAQGHIEVLVANAGVHLKKELLQVTDEDFDRVLRINLNSVFALSREVSKSMIEKGSGSIILISSMAAHYGLPNVIPYSASKTAIEGLTRALAVELSPNGIRVNCIAPGFIKTRMSSNSLDHDPARKERVLSRTPMGELGKPEDVANAVHFLASQEASYITGAVLPVDGGNSIGF